MSGLILSSSSSTVLDGPGCEARGREVDPTVDHVDLDFWNVANDFPTTIR